MFSLRHASAEVPEGIVGRLPERPNLPPTALILIESRRFGSAEQELLHCAEQPEQDYPRHKLWAEAGRLQLAQGKYAAAPDSFIKALGLNAADSSALVGLGRAYYSGGRLDLARSTIEKLDTRSEADPRVRCEALCLKGLLLGEKHYFPPAVKAIMEGLELARVGFGENSAEAVQARISMVQLLAKQGRLDQALQRADAVAQALRKHHSGDTLLAAAALEARAAVFEAASRSFDALADEADQRPDDERYSYDPIRLQAWLQRSGIESQSQELFSGQRLDQRLSLAELAERARTAAERRHEEGRLYIATAERLRLGLQK